jgi:hypothetical protein
MYGDDAGISTSIAVDSTSGIHCGIHEQAKSPITRGVVLLSDSLCVRGENQSTGAGLGYSTYLTNNAGAVPSVDSNNNAYVALGSTRSGFPVSSTAFQKTFGGAPMTASSPN